jgi:hypothetical protein
MATQRPHIQLNTATQREAPVRLSFNYGFGEQEDEEENPTPDYTRTAAEFRGMLTRLTTDLRTRVQERNAALAVPANIEYIRIVFQSQFVISDFYAQWRSEFGLLGTHFSQFSNDILFAVEDRAKFADFMRQIERFIQKESGQVPDLTYAGKVTFTKSFALLTTADMLQYGQAGPLMNVQLVDDFVLSEPQYRTIRASLEQYLSNQGLAYRLDEQTLHMEISGATDAQLREIAQNFDIVLQVTSSLATVVRPSPFGQPERSYGFEVANPGPDLPIAAIVDTGISDQTPLRPIIVPDQRFNLTATSPVVDNADHGTAIGALAALGRRAYENGYRGTLHADARLLPVKIMDGTSDYLSQAAVVDLLYQVKRAYPQIKIFVLTTCFSSPKRDNEDYSPYAYALDRFAHQTDSLVFICTANNGQANARNNAYDLTYFEQPETNLCPPAESINNITIGAAAGSLRPGAFAGVSDSPEYPTLYSRKGHVNLAKLYSRGKVNKHYFKPDLIEFGGDYEISTGGYMGPGLRASMQVLSSDPTQSFSDQLGTSFATGLQANPGLQIQHAYPGIRAQSIKALLTNSASLDLVRFEPEAEPLLHLTAGHGLADSRRSVWSDDNTVTFLIEDQISPEQVCIFPLHFPAYLTTLRKKIAIVRITATLCFSMDPLLTHQLAYCPVHIGFNFFRNHSGSQILAPERSARSLLKPGLSWSQNARHRRKPIPYTNTQKVSFLVGRDLLISESSTFKLAVNCRINPQLLPGTETVYRGTHPFSLVVTVQENLKDSDLTGQLYSEMVAINQVINIARAEGQALAEGEA